MTTPVTPATLPGTDTRPAAPAGHVYLQDVLNVVRTHANANRWCGTAETVTAAIFELGPQSLAFKRATTGGDWCCESCNGPLNEWRARQGIERFTLTDRYAGRTIRIPDLKDALRRAWSRSDDDGRAAPRALIRDIIDMFGLPLKLDD